MNCFSRRNIILFCCYGVLISVLGVSCSTKKNTFTRRAYHNLTAHYNAYFNGNEAFKEAVNELAKRSKDNFNKVIPVFQYGTKEEAQTQYALFDRAIEKASIVIQRHSIYIKRVEHVKWIDDAYFLIGKSYLYKQDYDMALQTFAFIRERYKSNPIVNDALLYQIRTYNQMGRFRDAEALIPLIDKKVEKNKTNRRIEKLFPLVMADFYLQQEKYAPSIEHLLTAYKLNKSRKIRTRVCFILAQVFQRTGNLAKATEYYQKVLNYNPVYEMAFAAKINIAKCYDATSGDSKTIRKILKKMLKDEKNKDFLDQIYYAMAEVYLKEGNDSAAIRALKLSARTSVSNNYQKGMSYLKLGDLYYAATNYKPAQMYYDSAIRCLPKDYPNYATIESKTMVLTELVKNLNVVELEDSLQRLGRMSYSERIAAIDRIIAELRKEEERKRQEEIDRQINMMNLQQMGFQNPQNQNTGSWYFYNPQMVSMGAIEFKTKWGNRKLEDLWRLSNKVAVDFDIANTEHPQNENTGQDSVAAFDPKDRNSYLKAIPSTKEDFEKSDRKIMEALYNIGVIYKDGLEDYPKAIQTFGTLFGRFPDNPYILPSYYYLYRIYYETEDYATAETYKNLIISKYPNSDYARILSDPNYYLKIDSVARLEEVFYSKVYKSFNEGKYDFVIRSADSAIRKFKDKQVIPKFEYIRAVSIGITQGDSVMIPELKKIVANYKESPVSKLAQNLINLRSSQKSAPAVTEISGDTTKKTTTSAEVNYTYDPDGFHFYIAVFDAVKVKMTEIKNLYSDHNSTMFKLDKLTVNGMFLDNARQMITVNRFSNKEKAMDYYLSVKNNSSIMSALVPANLEHFVISANNYTPFYRNKNVKAYLEFFNKFYLNQ